MATWKDEALHDYQYSGMSIAELAEKYHRARSTILKMITRSEVDRAVPTRNARGGRPAFDSQAVYSPLHKQIGLRLNLLRTLQYEELASQFAERVQMSTYVLRKVEQGLHDLTLTELQRISKVMELPLEEVIKFKQPEIHATRHPTD